jgi:uncharacterized protein YndB with AHSA1/START domain
MAEFASSIEIAATPDAVFDYLVTADGLTAWLGQRAEVEPTVGGGFAVDIAGQPIRGEYLEVQRPHRVVVSWGVLGSDEFGAGASRVSFTLSAVAAGTRVDLLHEGLPDARVAGHVDGWAHFLPRLAVTAAGGTAAEDGWVPLPLRGTA